MLTAKNYPPLGRICKHLPAFALHFLILLLLFSCFVSFIASTSEIYTHAYIFWHSFAIFANVYDYLSPSMHFSSTDSSVSDSTSQPEQPQTQSNLLNEMFPHFFNDLQQYHGELVQTSSPIVLCSKLPTHGRRKECLTSLFSVIVLDNEIPNGTEVVITAGNEENCNPRMWNNKAPIENGVAEFLDLCFDGCSGRIKPFSVTITIRASTTASMPDQIATYSNAINVTDELRL